MNHRDVISALNDFAMRELEIRKPVKHKAKRRHPLPPKLSRIRELQKVNHCSLNEALRLYEAEQK